MASALSPDVARKCCSVSGCASRSAHRKPRSRGPGTSCRANLLVNAVVRTPRRRGLKQLDCAVAAFSEGCKKQSGSSQTGHYKKIRTAGRPAVSHTQPKVDSKSAKERGFGFRVFRLKIFIRVRQSRVASRSTLGSLWRLWGSCELALMQLPGLACSGRGTLQPLGIMQG